MRVMDAIERKEDGMFYVLLRSGGCYILYLIFDTVRFCTFPFDKPSKYSIDRYRAHMLIQNHLHPGEVKKCTSGWMINCKLHRFDWSNYHP